MFLVAKSGLDIYAYNVETVEELTPFVCDCRATFRQSLKVREHMKKEGVCITKISILRCVGETGKQVMDALRGLHKINVKPRCRDLWVIYEAYEAKHEALKVERYVESSEFD
ncbi:hypothetical protein F4604DRAFT_2008777 [Suillus subluteus]|nr:hypothetical protein F4604DRAFT_2008777 [Suillus subluteus]